MRNRTLVLAALLSACSDEGGGAGRTPDGGALITRDAAQQAVPDAAQPSQGDAAQPAPDASQTSSNSGHYFPDGAFMYKRVDAEPVDPDSPTITKWLADNGGWGTGSMRIDFTIEVLTADPNTPKRTFVKSDDFYTPDCDFVPFPVPAGGVLEGESGYACEGDGDCHLIVVSRAEHRLYEMWRANIVGSNYSGGCAAVWDMSRVYGPEGRGEQCTSADAGGFPIAPLLFTADEVAAGSVDHAIRFILPNARMRSKTYQHPGNHAGGPSGPTNAPIYGSRWRLKSGFNLASLPNDGARAVARGLQQYGMVLADGGNIALTAQSDRYSARKWDGLLGPRDLASIQPTDFEVVQTGEPVTLTFDCQRMPLTQ